MVLSETHSSSPNSSFPPPLGPPSKVSSSTIWISHEGIIPFPNCFLCCHDENLGLRYDSNYLNPLEYIWMFLIVLHMFLVVHHMFVHITSFDLKSTSRIWKICLFNNSFKSLNLRYHHSRTFTRIYFSIQMQYLINWIRVITCTHFKFNMQIDW